MILFFGGKQGKVTHTLFNNRYIAFADKQAFVTRSDLTGYEQVMPVDLVQIILTVVGII